MVSRPVASWPAGMHVLERGWVSSNNIVMVGREQTAVVDTGYVRHSAQTLALLRHVLEGRALHRIVNTHTHSDHIGGNATLQAAWPEVQTTIPAGEAEVVQRWDEQALHLWPLGQECAPFHFEATYAPGDLLQLGDFAWRALGSPGHDMDSLLLYCEREGILISADALWENGFGVLFPEFTGETAPGTGFAAQRATLDMIAALDVGRVIPGHGAPFTDIKNALARAYSRLDYLEADPHRNDRNAAKVTLAFMLMAEGRIALADLAPRFARMQLLQEMNRRGYGLDDEALAARLVADLEKSGVARREEGWLVAI